MVSASSAANLAALAAKQTAAAKANSTAKKKRKKNPPPPPSVISPLPCVVLSVDAAGNSGWAIWSRGRLRCYGECDVFGSAVDDVISQAALIAEQEGLCLALATERPFRIRFSNQTSIGAGEKIWREKAKRSGHFGSRFVRFYPSTWRSRTLGKGWGKKKRKEAREHEQEVARAVARAAGYPVRVGEDAAPAILIGRCATYSGELARVLPKRAWKTAS